MKRIGLFLVVFALIGGAAFAEMGDRAFVGTVTGVTTSTVSYVLRGALEAVQVDVTAPATSTVTVASGGLTLFSKADIAADAVYLPRVGTHLATGVANTNFDKGPMAGLVTVTVLGQNAVSVTNATTVTLIYSK